MILRERSFLKSLLNIDSLLRNLQRELRLCASSETCSVKELKSKQKSSSQYKFS